MYLKIHFAGWCCWKKTPVRRLGYRLCPFSDVRVRTSYKLPSHLLNKLNLLDRWARSHIRTWAPLANRPPLFPAIHPTRKEPLENLQAAPSCPPHCRPQASPPPLGQHLRSGPSDIRPHAAGRAPDQISSAPAFPPALPSPFSLPWPSLLGSRLQHCAGIWPRRSSAPCPQVPPLSLQAKLFLHLSCFPAPLCTSSFTLFRSLRKLHFLRESPRATWLTSARPHVSAASFPVTA